MFLIDSTDRSETTTEVSVSDLSVASIRRLRSRCACERSTCRSLMRDITLSDISTHLRRDLQISSLTIYGTNKMATTKWIKKLNSTQITTCNTLASNSTQIRNTLTLNSTQFASNSTQTCNTLTPLNCTTRNNSNSASTQPDLNHTRHSNHHNSRHQNDLHSSTTSELTKIRTNGSYLLCQLDGL